MQAKTKIALASSALLSFIGVYEGLRTEAYIDPVGIPTICYGSTQGVEMGQTATKEQCDSLLEVEASHYGTAVLHLVKVPINQNQYDALVSFTYNVGIGNFSRSTLLRKLNRGDYEGASKEFSRWVYAGGKKLPGLIKRRKAEELLFTKPLEPDNEKELTTEQNQNA